MDMQSPFQHHQIAYIATKGNPPLSDSFTVNPQYSYPNVFDIAKICNLGFEECFLAQLQKDGLFGCRGVYSGYLYEFGNYTVPSYPGLGNFTSLL